jgi:hypothetical protein
VSVEAPVNCDGIRGTVFRPFFGRPLSEDDLEGLIRALPGLPVEDLVRRWDEEDRVFCIDWRQGQVAYTAGIYQGELTFVNIRFTGPHALDAEQVTAARVVECLGAPSQVQAWFDAYPYTGAGGLHAALVFIPQRAIAFAMRYYSPVPETPPPLDGSLPISMIGIFGELWAEDHRVLAKSEPWPGDWASVHVERIIHEAVPTDEVDDDEPD